MNCNQVLTFVGTHDEPFDLLVGQIHPRKVEVANVFIVLKVFNKIINELDGILSVRGVFIEVQDIVT